MCDEQLKSREHAYRRAEGQQAVPVIAAGLGRMAGTNQASDTVIRDTDPSPAQSYADRLRRAVAYSEESIEVDVARHQRLLRLSALVQAHPEFAEFHELASSLHF